MNLEDARLSPADLAGGIRSPSSTLRLYLVYRVALAAVILVMFASGRGPAVLGGHLPELFAFAATAYLGLTLLSLALAYLGSLPPASTGSLAIFVDILATMLLTHASGGTTSGLGTLLAISIALASLSLGGRMALLFAALATLGVMAEQLYGQLSGTLPQTAYTHAGLLGASFFALALLAHELSARLRQTEALAHQRGFDLANLAELNDSIIQHMQTGVVVVDEQDRVRLMNDAAWYLLGMPEAARSRPLRETAPALAAQLDAWRTDPRSEAGNFRGIAGGPELQPSFTALGEYGSGGNLIFLEDTATLTERAQQLKLASLGQLTASIAHEIRNPLGAISHAAQLLQESPDLPATDRRLADIVQDNARRLNQVIESVLKLSRRQERAPKPLVLTPWLAERLDELGRDLKLDPEQVRLHVEPEGTTVYADPGQLRQVLAVLLDNAVRHFDGAREAMRLTVAAGITRESGGPFVDIVDNGPGIPMEAAGKLFEPFFTTRSDGTGLGLYIARELCEANRVRLEYVPLPTRGSCFRLSFPDPRTLERPA